MARLLSVLAVLVTVLPVFGQEPTIPPRTITLASGQSASEVAVAIAKQTGIEIDISGIDGSISINEAFDKTPFWKAVESIAQRTNSRVEIQHQGKLVRFAPLGTRPRPPVSIDGPFRIEARQVDARIDLTTGQTIYDLTLQIAWEPQLPVFRMDSHPRVLKGLDDAGRPITVNPINSRTPVYGNSATLTVRVDGLTRESKRIASLPGVITVTAADEMLRFSFDDLSKPMMKRQKGIGVGFRSFAKQGTYWAVDLDLQYPAESATFESFETFWLGRNRLTLIGPDGTKVTSDDAVTTIRFKESKDFRPAGDLSKWRMEYTTPGIIREIPVRFELKDIRLP